MTGGDELLAAAHTYLDPLTEAGVDTLILGCTHYPLLTGVISYVMGDGVTLVSSAEECAKDVYRMLADTGLMRDDGGEPTYRFVTTGSPAEFETIGRRFLGPEMVAATQFAGPTEEDICEAHDRRLLGVLPGARLARELLPAREPTSATASDKRTWRILLDLGNGALGQLHRYVDPLIDRRGADQPPPRRPLPRPVRLLRDAQVPPDRRAAADPGVGSRPAPATASRAPTSCRSTRA